MNVSLNIVAAFLNCSIVFADRNRHAGQLRDSSLSKWNKGRSKIIPVIRILIDQDETHPMRFNEERDLINGVSSTRSYVIRYNSSIAASDDMEERRRLADNPSKYAINREQKSREPAEMPKIISRILSRKKFN